MAGTQGGARDRHVKSGEQSHDSSDSQQSGSDERSGSQQGGAREQHGKAGQQSRKNS